MWETQHVPIGSQESTRDNGDSLIIASVGPARRGGDITRASQKDGADEQPNSEGVSEDTVEESDETLDEDEANDDPTIWFEANFPRKSEIRKRLEAYIQQRIPRPNRSRIGRTSTAKTKTPRHPPIEVATTA